MKRITASLLVLVLMFSAFPAAPAAAYNWSGGYWASSEIGDGLQVCMTDDTSPTYENREMLIQAMNIWGQAIDVTFEDQTSLSGFCVTTNDIEVNWIDYGDTCAQSLARVAVLPANNTAMLAMDFNANCGENSFYWGASGLVPSGLNDAFDVAAHEAGHALGLGHTDEVFITTDNPKKQVWFDFDDLCGNPQTYKWDKSCTWPTSPKDTSGKIYASGSDAGVGNYSSSPRPNLPADTYHVEFIIGNDSLTRNPNGVRLELYQGTTLKFTSAYTSGTALLVDATDVTFTAQADFRFRVQSSKASIYKIRLFTQHADGEQLMEPFTPHCDANPDLRPTVLSQDDADGIRAVYPSLALTGVFGTDLYCTQV